MTSVTRNPIEGRNQECIDDDALVETHTLLHTSLNKLCGNLGLLYTGSQRVEMKKLYQACDAAIAGTGPYPRNLFYRLRSILMMK